MTDIRTLMWSFLASVYVPGDKSVWKCRCVRMEAAALRALALYKQRFLAQLTPMARQSADFSRPAFIAAAFYLSARKVTSGAVLAGLCYLTWLTFAGLRGPWSHETTADQTQAKLKVDRAALLQRHGLSAGEFTKITSSMTDLCFDVLVRNCSHHRVCRCMPRLDCCTRLSNASS